MSMVEAPVIHWNSPDGIRYQVQCIKGPLNIAEIEVVKLRAFEIHRQGLKYNPFLTVEQLNRNMQAGRDGSIYFARTVGEKPQDVGYVSQRVMEVEVDDEKIRALFVSTNVFLPEHQEKGLGTFFAEQANLMHRPDIFVGMTQSPYVILSHRRTGLFIKILPIDELFGDSTERLNKKQRVLEIIGRRTGNPGVDLRTGLVKGVYPKGESRAFILDNDNLEAVEIYRIQSEVVGVDHKNGDGHLYAAIKEEALELFKEEARAA